MQLPRFTTGSLLVTKVQILSSSRLQADGQKTGEILVDYDDHPFWQLCCVMDIV